LLQALLKGKLTREEENLEDLLTSNVLGSIKYVLPEEGLLPFLKNCQNKKSEPLLTEGATILEVNYQFWPWLKETKNRGCEPDVLIFLRLDNGQNLIILLEAKYRSGKSSEAIEESESNEKTLILNDQLAVEWDNLVDLANREKATPVLLYVTADIYFPKKEIEESCKEYKKCRYEDMNVFWISWRKLPNLFFNSDNMILSDLVKVLKKIGLSYFERITATAPVKITWSFKKFNEWCWSKYALQKITWNYRQEKSYNWKITNLTVNWGYKNNEQ